MNWFTRVVLETKMRRRRLIPSLFLSWSEGRRTDEMYNEKKKEEDNEWRTGLLKDFSVRFLEIAVLFILDWKNVVRFDDFVLLPMSLFFDWHQKEILSFSFSFFSWNCKERMCVCWQLRQKSSESSQVFVWDTLLSLIDTKLYWLLKTWDNRRKGSENITTQYDAVHSVWSWLQ